jgi:hypothetical protein
MPENPTPRQMLKSLLQRIAPPRPLFLPIVFSLGARVESVPLRSFLGNPTKIFNALRRVRAPLRADGLACYFDPWLETEALGLPLDWESDDRPPRLLRPAAEGKGILPETLRSPEQAAGGGRVAVAVEVIRRLNAVLRDEPVLMAGVTGPFTLAARLTGMENESELRAGDFPAEALEIAAAMITRVASAFVEAGANLIFLQEDVLPLLSEESCDDWASRLAPALNIIRFYQALPVLYFSARAAITESRDRIFHRQWDCILCPELDATLAASAASLAGPGSAPLALALPLDSFQPESGAQPAVPPALTQAVAALHPAILTTAGDVPPGTDMKLLLRVLGEIPRAF